MNTVLNLNYVLLGSVGVAFHSCARYKALPLCVLMETPVDDYAVLIS